MPLLLAHGAITNAELAAIAVVLVMVGGTVLWLLFVGFRRLNRRR